jgi:4-aminobutyrate aminotransferase-like enzyme
VNRRALQFFFFAAAALSLSVMLLRGALSSGETYSLSFVDIDGNKLSIADGHVTVLVVAATADLEKARAVGERVPDYCLGNPDYRMITIIRFIRKHGPIVRKIAIAVVKHRVTEEAKRLQNRYDTNKIMRDARQDIFTVIDFDGTVSSQLGEPTGGTDFCVFVFGRQGELLAQWHGLPSAKQLAAVVK